MTNQQLITDLKTARDLLAKPNGFLHHRLWDFEGGYCSSGALMASISGASARIRREEYNPFRLRDSSTGQGVGRYAAALAVLAKHLPARLFDDEGDVVMFNNSHTQEEVVELFDKALADLGGLG